MPKDMLSWDQTIFKNGEMFELDHVPEHFLHRSGQIEALTFNMRPAVRAMHPINTLCLGPPGTGKTTAVHKVFEEIEKHTSSVIPVHVNCQVDNTRYVIFSQIFQKIYGYMPPTSGVSFKKLFGEIAKYLIEKKRVLVVALDDVNYLFHENEVNGVLYPLLRAHEVYPGAKIGVIGVLSETGMHYVLDQRVNSVFLPQEIRFPPYARAEIHDILRNRIKYGFFPDVVPADVLDKIVDCVETSRDLRVGIDLLKRAGFNAERRASKQISIEDVDGAYEGSKLVHLAHLIRLLRNDEQTLLKLIAESGEIKAGELYKKFQEGTGLGYTRYHDMLNKLESIKLIDTNYINDGRRGRSRTISSRYTADEILNGLESI
ncbi:MAG: ORC1-type DNA replication protein [Methanosarcinales archaeon Met12]|nr:MAG: ORC1-type DNA replication protein [Methanosarcinales archaeon Met12]